MSEETPRLSRREMRERGLLKPVTTGTSPIEELSQTQELNLRRLSRKELRERSTASNEAVAAELAAAASSASPVTPDEPVIAPGQAEPKIGSARESVVSPGSSDNGARRSVFDRFSSAQGSADDSHDATAGSQKRELHAGADDASVSIQKAMKALKIGFSLASVKIPLLLDAQVTPRTNQRMTNRPQVTPRGRAQPWNRVVWQPWAILLVRLQSKKLLRFLLVRRVLQTNTLHSLRYPPILTIRRRMRRNRRVANTAC